MRTRELVTRIDIEILVRTIMSKRKFRTFEESQIEHYSKHPEELKSYIELSLEEYQDDGDEKAFLYSLAIAAKAVGGFAKLSRHTGLNRANLYKALSKNKDPRFSTVMTVIHSLGLSLKVA